LVFEDNFSGIVIKLHTGYLYPCTETKTKYLSTFVCSADIKAGVVNTG